MQLFPALPLPRNEACGFEDREMLGDRLACHVEAHAQLPECLAVLAVQPIEQLSPACVGQSVKHGVIIMHVHNTQPLSCILYMQPYSCLSSHEFLRRTPIATRVIRSPDRAAVRWDGMGEKAPPLWRPLAWARTAAGRASGEPQWQPGRVTVRCRPIPGPP